MTTFIIYSCKADGTNDLEIVQNNETVRYIKAALQGFNVVEEYQEVSAAELKIYLTRSPLKNWKVVSCIIDKFSGGVK